jgi:hypothetical protein
LAGWAIVFFLEIILRNQSMLKNSFSYLISRHQEKMLPTLLDGISDEQLAMQPIAGMNHPAWILGHILVVEQKIAGSILGRKVKTQLDANGWEVYGTGSIPKPDRKMYKTKEFYMGGLAETAAAIAAFISEKSDADLEAPNPDPQLGQFFPTIAIALAAAPVHRAYHSGQLASWRKAMGLPHAGM